MSLTITYDDTDTLGRVRLSFSGYSTNADYATVERSIDQVTWTQIRGGDKVALAAGAGKIDDYEYSNNVVNYYRVSAIDAADPSFVAAGTASILNNASVTPGIPAGLVDGGTGNQDLMVLIASIRNSGTGTVNLPAGWTSISNFGNVLVAGRYFTTGVAAPTVTFTGGAAGQDTMGRILGIRGSSLTNILIGTSLLNGSAQDVLSPSVGYRDKDYLIRFGWKQSTSGGMSATGYATLFGDSAAVGGSSQAAIGKLMSGAGSSPATVITWGGGSPAISRGFAVSFGKIAFTNQESGSITPVTAKYRLKSPSRPSLNVVIEPLDMTEVTRDSRTGIFNVVGRTLPVSVSDVQASRKFAFTIDVKGYSNRDDMDIRLATGEPMFLQPPTLSESLPTLYFIAGSTTFVEDAKMTSSFTFTIPVTEVAKPGATVYGDTFIWQDVINTYATWTDVIAAVSTWSNLIDKVSTSSIIVP